MRTTISTFRSGLFALALVAWLTPAVADDAQPLAAAETAFAAGDLDRALEILEPLTAEQPDCAPCAHLLGRTYGRMAEQANWTRAVALAKKTRSALENAVDLDPTNAPALEDLIRYYRSAPGFLGGDDAKARQLERRLMELRADLTT